MREERTSTVLGKVSAMTSPGLMPAERRRAAARSTRWWRRECVSWNLPETETAWWEGNIPATRWSNPVSVVGACIVVWL